MTEHTATITWQRAPDAAFLDGHYSRAHDWSFDGGATVAASASPHVVATPYSVPANVDPEEAFVAALSSCHMLTFLAIAAKRKFIIDAYTDNAAGHIERNEQNRLAITRVKLRPMIAFSGDKQPTAAQIKTMHEVAHRECFIANSVKTEVVIDTPPQDAEPALR